MKNGKWKMANGIPDSIHTNFPFSIFHLPFSIFHFPFLKSRG